VTIRHTSQFLKLVRSSLRSLYHLTRRFPVAGSVVSRIYEIRTLKNQFYSEICFLKGKRDTSDRYQSIVFFTIHKSASVYVGNMLKQLTTHAGMIAIDLDTYYFLSNTQEDTMRTIDWSATKRGYFFGPFRHYHPALPPLDEYKVILMVRDPRDVLTSLYFSHAYSHTIPSGTGAKAQSSLQIRNEALQHTIDEYVLKEASTYFYRYREYAQKLLHKPNLLFVRYEDMVTDFEKWLDPIITFLDVEVKKEMINQIMREANFKVERENVYVHKRQVDPGDHKRKLKTETIMQLTAECADILEAYGYTKE